MKLLFENWRKFTESSEDPELWGNCGMVAVAIAEEAKRRGLDPMLVFVHNADDEDTIMMGDYDLYHVAVTIGDDYYDDRGKISRDELNFDDFGEEDRDYYVDEFYLNERTKDAIKRNTNWDKCPADFKERALEILDNDEDELTPNQKEFPERYGNCGMLALALIEEGIKRKNQGIEIAFVTATDEDEFLETDEPEIHHVAMWFNGKYYDDRGEISEDQLGDFSPLGLTSPEGAKPKAGRDYIVLTYEMENNQDLKLATDIVKNNTDWWKSCEEYMQRAEDFWENVNNETPLKETEAGHYDPDLGRYQMEEAPWQAVSGLIADIVMSMRRAGDELPSREELFNMVDHEPYASYEEYKAARKKDMEGYANWFRDQRGWSK